MISEDMSNATSSPESEAGHTPSNSPDGQATGPCGPGVVPVSRFRALDSAKAMPTNDTSGPLFSASSPSAALSAFLANRLQARMDVNGSPEYVLTWKHWDMPAGALICRLRASARRTIGQDSIGWPTPVAADGHKNIRSRQGALNEIERAGPRGSDLNTVAIAAISGWPTADATAANINDSTFMDRREVMKSQYNNGNGFGLTLGQAVSIAGWGTPQARDHKDTTEAEETPTNSHLPRQVQVAGWRTPDGMGGHHRGIPNPPERLERRISQGRQVMLADQAMLAGWTTPQAKEPNSRTRPSRAETGRKTEYLGRQVHGTNTNGSGAMTPKLPAADGFGALNPQFSCWLMGFPQEWLSCAESAMP